jgi:hypothetical protein
MLDYDLAALYGVEARALNYRAAAVFTSASGN